MANGVGTAGADRMAAMLASMEGKGCSRGAAAAAGAGCDALAWVETPASASSLFARSTASWCHTGSVRELDMPERAESAARGVVAGGAGPGWGIWKAASGLKSDAASRATRPGCFDP